MGRKKTLLITIIFLFSLILISLAAFLVPGRAKKEFFPIALAYYSKVNYQQEPENLKEIAPLNKEVIEDINNDNELLFSLSEEVNQEKIQVKKDDISPILEPSDNVSEESVPPDITDSNDSNPVTPESNITPIASAGSDRSVNLGKIINFIGINSYDIDGTIVSYHWDFGDGNTKSGVIVNHRYTAAGRYTIKLTVTDDDGATHSDTALANINKYPVANAGLDQKANVGKVLNFNGLKSSDSDGKIVSYKWNFGDGSSGSGSSVNHSYAAGGVYKVTLTVTDDDGATHSDTALANINEYPLAAAGPDEYGYINQSIDFDGTLSTDVDGTIVSYQWDFGDGSFGSGSTISYSYTSLGIYTVTLTVTDDDGAISSDTLEIAIEDPLNQLPVANAGSDQTAYTGQIVSFNGLLSTDIDGFIVSYQWDFGDGTSSFGSTVNHTYALVEIYTVTLTVTDDDGAISTDTLEITINQTPNQRPIADAGPNQSGFVDQQINFSGSLSSDPDGSIVNYDWNFGDGNTGTGLNVNHIYSASGIYTITLTVIDDVGATDSDTTIITINESPNQAPVADAGPDQIGNPGQTVSFSGALSSDPDGSIVSYEWNFGDGNTGTGLNVNHTYASTGIYTVTLTVTDNLGATDSDTAKADIRTAGKPIADAGPDYYGPVGRALHFNGNLSYDPDGKIISYLWDFGDGNTSSQRNPNHIYSSAGTYNVTLIVTDDSGLTDIDTAIYILDVDLAALKPIMASDFRGAFYPENAVDLSLGSKWRVDSVSTQWIQVDMQNSYLINRVIIYWANPFAVDYIIEVSQDNSTWDLVSAINGSEGTKDVILLSSVNARYLRLTCTKSSNNGYRISELEIYD